MTTYRKNLYERKDTEIRIYWSFTSSSFRFIEPTNWNPHNSKNSATTIEPETTPTNTKFNIDSSKWDGSVFASIFACRYKL